MLAIGAVATRILLPRQGHGKDFHRQGDVFELALAQASARRSDFPLARLDQETLARVVGESRDIEDIYPLTPLQQGMLFHNLYEPEAGIGYEQVSCRLEGELDVTAFARAWAAVVKRAGVKAE